MPEARRPLPPHLRRAAARLELDQAIAGHRPRGAARAAFRLVRPGSWEPGTATRRAILDRAVAAGDPAAARIRVEEAKPALPGSSEALARAAALEVLAAGLPPREAELERTVAAVLREGRPERILPAPGATAAAALAGARHARAEAGRPPWVLATLPGLAGNPYSSLMEGAFASRGLAAVHVETLDEVEEIVAGREGGGYAAALHVNAPNRIIAEARDAAAAMAAAEAAIDRIDAWRAAGVPLVVSIHDGPIATPAKAAAERALAQAIVDRSRAIHILVRATPALLAGWITIDPARCIHVPHPSYDGVYAATPPRAAARAALGLDTVDPADGGREVVLGMIGTLRARKGVPRLLEALAAVPDPLPGGRRLRLLLAGRPDGPDAEEVVRRAWADQRVILRAGTVADDDLPRLLGAIDVAVVPYERYLISGWLLLALTAAIPVVAEAGAAADETVLPGALQPFRDGVGGLAAALARAPHLATREARREARRSVAALAPDLVSARFADALRSALEATEQQPA